jgi:hypothetical protein
METFLKRHQVEKADPGVEGRKAKAKAHRRIEKLIDKTLFKRKRLETRTTALAQGPGDIATSRLPGVVKWRTGNDIHGHPVAPKTILEETLPGDPTGFALHHTHLPIRRPTPSFPNGRTTEQLPGTRFFKHVIGGHKNAKKYEDVQVGQHLKDLEAKRSLENPKIHPGLMTRHMLGIK